MNFSMFLRSLYELQTAETGTERTYWHYTIIKNSEIEYSLSYRDSCFAKCNDIPSAIFALQASYNTIHIEFN